MLAFPSICRHLLAILLRLSDTWLQKGDMPDQKQKPMVVDLPTCTISELLQGTYKGRKYCLRLLENRKKEMFLATDSGEVLREWLRSMIAEGAVAASPK